MPTWVKENDVHHIDVEEKNTNDIFSGGGTGGLPAISPSDVGKTLVAKEEIVKGEILLQVDDDGSEDNFMLSEDVPDWFKLGEMLALEYNGKLYYCPVHEDGGYSVALFYFDVGEVAVEARDDTGSLALYAYVDVSDRDDKITLRKPALTPVEVVPEQTVMTDDGVAVLDNVDTSNFLPGKLYAAYVNGALIYSMSLEDDGFVVAVAGSYEFLYGINDEGCFFHGSPDGEYTVSLSVLQEQKKLVWASDEYAGYDAVLKLTSNNGSPRLFDMNNAELVRGSYAEMREKLLRKEPIKVFAYGYTTHDNKFPYTSTFSVQHVYYDNYDTEEANHLVALFLAEYADYLGVIRYRHLYIYPNSIAFGDKYKVSATKQT